jgi:hypothetical protein
MHHRGVFTKLIAVSMHNMDGMENVRESLAVLFLEGFVRTMS